MDPGTIGLVSFIATCIGAGFFADDRYAKCKDLQKFMIEHKNEVRQAANDLRRQMLEDQIFGLDLIPAEKQTDVQRAISFRAKAQLSAAAAASQILKG